MHLSRLAHLPVLQSTTITVLPLLTCNGTRIRLRERDEGDKDKSQWHTAAPRPATGSAFSPIADTPGPNHGSRVCNPARSPRGAQLSACFLRIVLPPRHIVASYTARIVEPRPLPYSEYALIGHPRWHAVALQDRCVRLCLYRANAHHQLRARTTARRQAPASRNSLYRSARVRSIRRVRRIPRPGPNLDAESIRPSLPRKHALLVIVAHNAVLLRCSAVHPHPRVRYPFASAPRITYPPALSYDACPSWISHTKAHPRTPHESRCTIPTRKMSTRAKLDGSSRAHTRRLRLGPHTHPARVSRTIHTHPPREWRPIRAHTSSWTPSSLTAAPSCSRSRFCCTGAIFATASSTPHWQSRVNVGSHGCRKRASDAERERCEEDLFITKDRHTIISSFACTFDCRPSAHRTPSTRAARASSDGGISARTIRAQLDAPAKRELDVKRGFARLRTSCGPPDLTASVRRIPSPRMHPHKAHLRITGRVRCPDA
ncbi:hypothetical protein C8R44DRAFT_896315 [Mycena epipterygia]|nr:hypothetical protein C8R44DRAFT_896315 [Mycena epipterygia]